MSYTNVVFNQNIGKSVNRDTIQKQRIDDRVGFQTRFQTAEKQRFNKNFQVNDRIARESQRDRKDQFYQARLHKRMERDQQRWQKQSQLEQLQANRINKKNQVLTDNRRNTNGIGYNPINHAYEESNRGNKLYQHDQSKQVNRYVRSKNIIEKNIPKYNIITGGSNEQLRHAVPEKYQQRVDQKYAAKLERETIRYQPKRDKYDYLDD